MTELLSLNSFDKCAEKMSVHDLVDGFLAVVDFHFASELAKSSHINSMKMKNLKLP